MPNPYGATEITVAELAARLMADPQAVVLDVREPDELELVRLPGAGVVNVPLSRLAASGVAALPENLAKETPMAVLCHHGVRSARATVWLTNNGWTDVVSVAGGLAEYAGRVDASIGTY